MKATYDISLTALKNLEELLQTLTTGLSSSTEESASSGYMGQLANLKIQISTLTSEGEKAKARIEHLKKELKEKEPKAREAEKSGKGLLEESEGAKREVVGLETKLGKLNWDEGREGELRGRREVESRAVRELSEVSFFLNF